MTHWNTPIGPDPLNRAVQLQRLKAGQARELARVVRETSVEAPKSRPGATAGGDSRKLRGIPCLARGVGGAIDGTRPTDAIR